MSERILTLHPQGKTGVNIEREKYDLVRQTILDTISSHGQLTFNEVMEAVNQQLEGRFDGSISWYTTCDKLDLEARGEIERVLNSRPQRLQIAALRLPKS